MRAVVIALVSLFYGTAFGLTTFVPENAIEIELHYDNRSIEIPSAAFTTTMQPMELINGRIESQSWRINDLPSSQAILEAMIDAYERQSYKIDFRCQASGCGGFSFRYALELDSAPKFLVDLGNFEYVSMRSDQEIVTVFVTYVDGITYLSQIHIQPRDSEQVDLVEKSQSTQPATNSETRWILSSVRFASGSSVISEKDDEELQKIADRLSKSNEILYIVGHTDQTGRLQGNLNLSQARANSVRNALIKSHSIDPSRVIAKGVAFLAPIADNATQEGRNSNRRVEAVFLQN